MPRILALLALLLVTGGAQAAALFQTSPIDALLAGVYDGPTTFAELRRHGDFGLGTLNGLDGELLLLDGRLYQFRTDGKAYPVPATGRTPFATVAFFRPGKPFPAPEGLDMAAFQSWLDQRLGTPNRFYAVRVKGRFAPLKTRSVPRQTPPYRPLAEVVKEQAVFDAERQEGTLVGFRAPPFVKGVNVPGYHFHFLARDRRSGGHVLDFRLEQGTVEVQILDELVLRLPPDLGNSDLARDRGQELDRVEKGHGR